MPRYIQYALCLRSEYYLVSGLKAFRESDMLSLNNKVGVVVNLFYLLSICCGVVIFQLLLPWVTSSSALRLEGCIGAIALSIDK